MARGFGATLGVGATDKVATNLSTDPASRSYFAWFNFHGTGGGGGGRLMDQITDSLQGTMLIAPSTTSIGFQRNFNGGTNGNWSSAGITADTWNVLGISYTNSATSNDPIFYLNSSKLTVGSGLTRNSTPTGTAISLATFPIWIGNRRSDIARNFDGMIAEAAIWDAILTDDEFFALCKGYSPLLIRPQSLVEHIPLLRNNVSSRLAAPTIVGTVVQPHPRIIMPYPQQRRRLSTAAAFKAAWSRASNLPVLGTGNF